MSRPRLLATVRVHNESWILEHWLKRTCEYADGIIAINDASTDDSPKILRSCPKMLAVVDNPPGGIWDQFRDRNRLLEEARRLKAEWVHVIDPDEIMDVRLAARLDELLGQGNIGRIFFKEITLWRSTGEYRTDRPDMYHRNVGTNQMLRLRPGLRWIPSRPFRLIGQLRSLVARGRLIPVPRAGYEALRGVHGETMHVEEIVRLHYHFVDWNRAWLVHLRYAAREAIQMKKPLHQLHDLVQWATNRLDESGLTLAPVRSEWGVIHFDCDPAFCQAKYG